MSSDLVAVGGVLAINGQPYYFEEFDVWIKLLPASGLVDLNTSHLELVMAVFRATGVRVDDLRSRLGADRTVDARPYRSVADAFEQLQVSEGDRSKLVPFVTVATGSPSVDPDKAQTQMQQILRAVLTDHDLEAAEDDPTDMRLVMTASDIDGPFVPRLYVAKSADGAFRLVEFADNGVGMDWLKF